MMTIFVLSAVILGWVAYDTLPEASTHSERVIVNDDYSAVTQPVTDGEGIKQTIQVKGGTRLYGVSVNFHIFNRVQFGIAHVDLLDSSGNILAKSSRDMTAILDNTFKGFIFDNMQCPAQDTEYVLHVWAEPQTAEDCFALWRSETEYDGFGMTENGTLSNGMIALQYINRHVGNSIYGWYTVFSVLVVAGLELLYLCIFVLNVKTHTAFAVAALFMGMIFSWFTPINGGPDEYVHFASSYKFSNRILNRPQTTEYGKVTMRSCDAIVRHNGPVEYNAFSFAEMYDGLKQPATETDMFTDVDARTADVFKPLYLAQSVGISLARAMNFGFVPLVLMGRLFNLLQYILLIYIAIRMMPIYKPTLSLIALLPMSMQIAGNFAYDAYVIAMAFLFISLVFRLTYGKAKIEYKDLIPLTVVLCLLAPAKTIYILMGLIVFMLPSVKFPDKRKAELAKFAVLAMAIAFWMATNLTSVVNTILPHNSSAPQVTVIEENINQDIEVKQEGIIYPYEMWMEDNQSKTEEIITWDPNSDILPNGDSRYYYSIPYILKNIKATIKLILRTITTHTGKYLQTIVGTRLGEIIVVDLQASWIWFILLIAILYLSVTPVKNRDELHTTANKLIGILVFVLVTGRTVAACIMWTPINYETIFGIQGRYLLPALPLFVMAVGYRNLKLEKSLDRFLNWCILPLDILVVLNVFMIMAQR